MKKSESLNDPCLEETVKKIEKKLPFTTKDGIIITKVLKASQNEISFISNQGKSSKKFPIDFIQRIVT